MDEIMVTCDPGDNTALAVWREDDENFHLISEHFFKLTAKEKKLSIAQRQKLLSDRFEEALEDLKILHHREVVLFVIEGVSLWGQSSKSQSAALRGDSFRLAYLVGALILKFQTLFTKAEVEVIDVRTWKGSLPTDILEKEVERFTGKFPENEHLACAIGIGMNKIGAL